MLIGQKSDNVKELSSVNKIIDWLLLEWYEVNKRILHKRTTAGTEISLKFLDQNPELREGDILWQDEKTIIAVSIQLCECIIMQPKNTFEVASLCYEIGNKHLPLFYENDELLVAYEKPLFNQLKALGYQVTVGYRKLQNALKTTVAPHGNSTSLFNKILQLTTSPADVK